MYENGKLDSEIASQLKRSIASVANCRQAHKIQRPREKLRRGKPWLKEEKDILIKAYMQGDSDNEIAKLIARSRIAIKRFILTNNLKRDHIPAADLFDTNKEQWRVIKHVPEYAISNLGNVISLQLKRRRHILAQWIDKDGYAHVSLQINGKAVNHSIHRLMAIAFIGPPPSPKHHAAHNDGIPKNNIINNIEWKTPKQNQADRLIHGTAKRGPNGAFVKSKGTADMVRRAKAAGIEVIEIGNEKS